MARYRKLLIGPAIGLAAIVMVLYSHPLTDSTPQQNRPVYAVSGSERVDENQASSQNIRSGNDNQEVQTTIEDQSITKYSPEITIASENITLTGRVGTEFGEIIAGDTVVLYSPFLRSRYSTIANSSGEYVFTDLEPSYDYTLKVSPQGMYKRYVKFPIKLKLAQEAHNIVLEPIPLGILTGRISDPYGRPVTGIELTIKTLEVDSRSFKIMTDANGAFSVAEFPKGRFQLAIKQQQSLTASGLKFDPAAGEPVSLTIDLGPYSLTGRIYDESGQTFDGASIFLNWALQENGVRIRSTRQFSAEASGEFQFSGLGPGDHELVVSAWREDAFGKTIKQTIRQMVNVGVDSAELIIVINTLSLPGN
jgi:hypothetical protein